MSNRTLADELLSVLLSRALDAPEPAEAVQRILAATTGADPTGSDVPGRSPADTDRAHEGSAAVRPIAARRRRLPLPQLLGAAACIALLVLAVAGVRAANLGGSAKNSAGSADRAALPAAGADQAGSSNATGDNEMGPKTANGAAPSGSTSLASGVALDCAGTLPGSHQVPGAAASFTESLTGRTLEVIEHYCLGGNGQRGGSQVDVFAQGSGGLQYLSTLVAASKGAHLQYLATATDTVTLHGTTPDSTPPGQLVTLTYTTRDGGRTFAVAGKVVAQACQRKDLSATVLSVAVVGPADGKPAAPAYQVLQLTNATSSPCALEGYPKAVPSNAGGAGSGPALAQTLHGPAGGVTKGLTPPIIELIPGGTAGAIIESGSSASCTPTSELTVTLANGVSLGAVPAVLSQCRPQIHPLVDNPLGSQS